MMKSAEDGLSSELAGPPGRCASLLLLRPGAGRDALARTLAGTLSRRWAQPVVIDNRPGGDGIVFIETFLAAREGICVEFLQLTPAITTNSELICR